MGAKHHLYFIWLLCNPTKQNALSCVYYLLECLNALDPLLFDLFLRFPICSLIPLSSPFTVAISEHKGWELVADEQARADEVVASMADSIYFFEEKRPPKSAEAEAKA